MMTRGAYEPKEVYVFKVGDTKSHLCTDGHDPLE